MAPPFCRRRRLPSLRLFYMLSKNVEMKLYIDVARFAKKCYTYDVV